MLGHQSDANAFHVAMKCGDVNNKPGSDTALKVTPAGGDITAHAYGSHDGEEEVKRFCEC